MAVSVAMLWLLTACGPSYQDLVQGSAKAPDVYAYAAEECDGYRDDDGCRAFIREICGTLQKKTEARVERLISTGDLQGAARVLSSQSVPPCPLGKTQYRVEVAALSETAQCGDEAGCRAERLHRALAHRALPIVRALIRDQKDQVCTYFSTTADRRLAEAAPAGMGDSSNGDVAPRFARLRPGLTALEKASNWCPDKALEAPVATLRRALDGLAGASSRSVSTLADCMDYVRKARWPAEHPVAQSCDVARVHARRHLDRWVGETLERGRLEGADLSHFAMAVDRLYGNLAITSKARARVARERRDTPALPVSVKIKGRESLGDFVFHTSQSVKRRADQIAQWARVEVSKGASSRAVSQPGFAVEVHIPADMVTDRREDMTEGRSTYLAGHREVPNPAYLDAERRCQNSTSDYERCQRQYDNDMTTFRSCEARQAEARANNRSVPYCRRPSICNSSRKLSDCGAGLSSVPPTLQEEVWRDHVYAIRHVSLSARLAAEVTVKGLYPHTLTARVQFEASDREVDPEPQYNVEGDPLRMPTRSAIQVELSRRLAGRVFDIIAAEHERICGHLKAQALDAEPHRSVSTLMAAERYDCGDKSGLIRGVVGRAL
ncbi:MAG: hypothetical protein ACE366_08090 [Bradymonadia bacterium]